MHIWETFYSTALMGGAVKSLNLLLAFSKRLDLVPPNIFTPTVLNLFKRTILHSLLLLASLHSHQLE